MEPGRGAVPSYGAMGTQSRPVRPGCNDKQAQVSVVNMADWSVSMHDVQEELVSIEALKERLIRRESELRYMVEDFQLCQEIVHLKMELKKLQLLPDEARPAWSRQREEELMSMVQALVDKRDILVEDLEFERRREQEEDRERASSAKRDVKRNTNEPVTSGPSGTQPPVDKPSLARTSLEMLQYCWNACCLPVTALTP
uniref:bMERB domain-containing protein 1-like isoform X1 n=2 Tax=Myxine glutinosa TaxID=7769 RepID=UPI00358DDB03